jgi:hypothetical protein
MMNPRTKALRKRHKRALSYSISGDCFGASSRSRKTASPAQGGFSVENFTKKIFQGKGNF